MSTNVQVAGIEKVVARLRGFGPSLQTRMLGAVNKEAADFVQVVKDLKLSGQVLNKVTGRLRNSIHAEVQSTETSVSATVGTNVKYARIHEYGGVTRPHDIVPTAAKALAFIVGANLGVGQLRFAKIVHHPGSKMPDRSFLRSTLAERAPGITARLTAAAAEAVDEANR